MGDSSRDILSGSWELRGNFNKQLSEVLQCIQLTSWEMDSLKPFYEDIERTLAQIWPGCKVKLFGSLMTDLALKDCVADCLLELPEGCEDCPNTCVEKVEHLIKNVRNPFQKPIKRMKRIPKTPYINFYHPRTKRYCNLCFNEPMTLEFGKLIKYFLSLDKRVPKLMILLKYWGRRQRLTHPKLLPTDALILLVVFFLQQKKILPPVSELQKTASPVMTDGWNTAFDSLPYRTENKQSVYELLREFFECYCEFDFRQLIICPYLGYAIERDSFLDVNNLPEAFQTYQDNLNKGDCEQMWLTRIMTVQDPFDHSRNCAKPVNPVGADKILKYLDATVHIVDTTTEFNILNEILHPYILHHEPYVRSLARAARNKPKYKYELAKIYKGKRIKKKAKEKARSKQAL